MSGPSPTSPFGQELRSLLARLDDQLAREQVELSAEDVTTLLAAAVRTAGAVLSADAELPAPPSGEAPTATDVVHVCNHLLHGADLEPFELGFWRNFTGALRTR